VEGFKAVCRNPYYVNTTDRRVTDLAMSASDLDNEHEFILLGVRWDVR
jgi:hypothetical protein